MSFIKPGDMGLFTDLYQLTMAQGYFKNGRTSPATFSLFIRKYPPDRSYFVAAGLQDVVDFLQRWSFSEESTDYLRSTGIFSAEFLEYLSGVRFTGNVRAMPEGRLCFVDEPLLEITAPIIEAQIVETFVINQINLQTLIATKAARCSWAANGRTAVDFSLRRTQGTDAGMKAARASYITGFAATSNVLAGKEYGIPISGTMAHSFVSSYEHEIDAFRAFAQTFPDNCVLLIDTYDTVVGAERAVIVGKEMEARGHRLRGVRLDSGDIATLSREVREVLNRAGFEYLMIIASGGLDEFEVENLVSSGAPIDGFGIGTKMGVSGDAPWLDMAYKLVKYDRRPVLKLSTGKLSLPGEKQVYRVRNGDGKLVGDILALREEPAGSGEPLLVDVMADGKVTMELPSLAEIKERFDQEFSSLDENLKALRPSEHYKVSHSPGLEKLTLEMQNRLKEQTSVTS